MEKLCGVYKITNPIGEVYIGQSTDIKRRWKDQRGMKNHFERLLKDSFREHGVDHHTFEIIEECGTYQLKEMERFHQEQYFLSGIKLLNLVLAGKYGYQSRVNDRTKALLAERTIRVHTGLKRSQSTKDKLKECKRRFFRAVIQMDLNGIELAEFQTAYDAAKSTNLQRSHIKECCGGKAKTHGGYKWKFKVLLS